LGCSVISELKKLQKFYRFNLHMTFVLPFLGSFPPSEVNRPDMVADSWRPELTVVSDDPVPLCKVVDRVTVERTAHVAHAAGAYVRGLCVYAKPRDQTQEATYQVPSS
jgi:hypothetical protein